MTPHGRSYLAASCVLFTWHWPETLTGQPSLLVGGPVLTLMLRRTGLLDYSMVPGFLVLCHIVLRLFFSPSFHAFLGLTLPRVQSTRHSFMEQLTFTRIIWPNQWSLLPCSQQLIPLMSNSSLKQKCIPPWVNRVSLAGPELWGVQTLHVNSTTTHNQRGLVNNYAWGSLKFSVRPCSQGTRALPNMHTYIAHPAEHVLCSPYLHFTTLPYRIVAGNDASYNFHFTRREKHFIVNRSNSSLNFLHAILILAIALSLHPSSLLI